MSPIRHILVPRDYSPPSEAALQFALRLAARADATLHLLHVEVLREDPYGSPRDAASPAARLRERLKELVEHDRAEAPAFEPESLRVEHAVVREVAAGPAITRHAAAIGADLIVMGRHARRGVGRAVLGSVAEYVSREAPCPVATVPAMAGAGNPAILCAVDLSPESQGAIEFAAGLAVATGARLDLVHASSFGDLAARDRLEGLAASALQGRDIDLYVHLHEGDAAEYVVEVAERLAPMLVVAGPRAHTGMARFLGSVTGAVVRDVEAPVVVVQRAEEVLPVPS